MNVFNEYRDMICEGKSCGISGKPVHFTNPNGLILGLTIEEVFCKVFSCLHVDLKLSQDKGKL